MAKRRRGRPSLAFLALINGVGLSACGEIVTVDRRPDASADRDADVSRDAGEDEEDASSASAVVYQECTGPDYGQGTCEEQEICAAMPRVSYKYCMPSPPCAADLVAVHNVACAYPCEEASDCAKHGLAKCAANDLAEIAGDVAGWCTP